ncbi:MAG: peptidylprolyl isomerase [Planctomycetes bacterium]|nr:peptidylprolyl isomerase [Planctomycetota bacterium]
MKHSIAGARSAGALAAVGWLALACAAQKVSSPPTPPPYAPQVKASASAALASEPLTPLAEPVAALAMPPQEPAKKPEAQPEALASKPELKRGPLGTIAGQPLEAEELLLELGDASPRGLFLVVDKLVAAHLALAEASRLGMRLDQNEVEQRYLEAKKQLEDEAARGKKPRALEEFIRRELGFEPGAYLERVRRGVIRQMLAERAVRAGSLASETLAVRLIVVLGEEQMKAVQAALAAGRDFGEVAREFSVDDSKEVGGLVPFVVREERSPLAALAFRTPVGELGGPMPISDHQFLLRVEEKRAPIEGDWATIEAKVLASLREHPVETSEFVHWKIETQARYPIDLGRLWSLVGAAR